MDIDLHTFLIASGIFMVCFSIALVIVFRVVLKA